MSANKTIVLVGDSHTWGQGAEDAFVFYPPVQAGDLRPLPFHVPCYANLLRKRMNELSGSACHEASALQGGILKVEGRIRLEPCFCLERGHIRLEAAGNLLRLFFQYGPDGAEGKISIDGEQAGVINTYDWHNGINNYKIWTYDKLEDKLHDIRIFLEEPTGNNPGNAAEGCLKFHRLESYSGPCRVINSGIGSCDSGKYLEKYWESYVLQYKPDIVVVEAFSINDWLQAITLKKYRENLEMLFKSIRDHGARPLLLTVSPILGTQVNRAGIGFDEYIHASRQAAAGMKVQIADANRAMKEIIEKDKNEESLFSDAWHVNKAGNSIYYECIARELALITT